MVLPLPRGKVGGGLRHRCCIHADGLLEHRWKGGIYIFTTVSKDKAVAIRQVVKDWKATPLGSLRFNPEKGTLGMKLEVTEELKELFNLSDQARGWVGANYTKKATPTVVLSDGEEVFIFVITFSEWNGERVSQLLDEEAIPKEKAQPRKKI